MDVGLQGITGLNFRIPAKCNYYAWYNLILGLQWGYS